MNAAELRSLLTNGSVLPCSPVLLVTADGRRFEIVAAKPGVEKVREENGVTKPAAVPTVTLRLRPID